MAPMFDDGAHDLASAASQRSLLDVERADAFDEDLLERRIGDLEAKDVAAASHRRAQDRLRVGAGVDLELGVVVARPGDRHVRQRPEPGEIAVAGGGDADDLVAGRALDVAGRTRR